MRCPSPKNPHLPADDPELWDFTLNGIELNGDSGSRLLGGRIPSTPRSHCMQTRNKTPQRGHGRPPDGREQEQAPPSAQYRHSTGEHSSKDFRVIIELLDNLTLLTDQVPLSARTDKVST